MSKDLLLLIVLLLFLVAIYRLLRKCWLLTQQQPGKRSRKPLVLRPKSERDCRFCQADNAKKVTPQREQQADPLAAPQGERRAKKKSIQPI